MFGGFAANVANGYPKAQWPLFCGVPYYLIDTASKDTFISEVSLRLSQMEPNLRHRASLEPFYTRSNSNYILHYAASLGLEEIFAFLLNLLKTNPHCPPVRSEDERASLSMLCKANDFGIEKLGVEELKLLPHPLSMETCGRSVLSVALLGVNAAIVGQILDSGVDVNRKVPNSFSMGGSQTPLQSLVTMGSDKDRKDRTELTPVLLRAKDLDIDATSSDGVTAFCLAVQHSRLDMLRMLYDAGANVNMTPKNECMLCVEPPGGIMMPRYDLTLAQQNNGDNTFQDERSKLVDYLMSLAEPTVPIGRRLDLFARHDDYLTGVLSSLNTRTGGLPLVTRRVLELADRLEPPIENTSYTTISTPRGAARLLSARSADGSLPLQSLFGGFVDSPGKDEIIRYVASSPFVDFANSDGTTALAHAIKRSNSASISNLLEVGASVNVTDNSGASLLEMAVKAVPNFHGAFNNTAGLANEINKFLSQLLDNGADIDAVNTVTGRPLGHTIIRDAEGGDSLPMLQLMRAEGLSFNTRDREGLTLIHSAAKMGNINLIEELAKLSNIAERQGAYVEAGSEEVKNSGQTAMHMMECPALFPCNPYSILKGLGLDIDAADANGDTPLHIAVAKKAMQQVTGVLLAGASRTTTNRNGETPLEVAERLLHKHQLAAKAETPTVRVSMPMMGHNGPHTINIPLPYDQNVSMLTCIVSALQGSNEALLQQYTSPVSLNFSQAQIY